MRGTRVPAAAILMLRLLLPACLVAATCVAAFGLFHVVSRPANQPASEQAPSLRLGAGRTVTTAPPTPAAPPKPTPRPTPLAPLTAPVAVFNASGVTGLAGRTATALRLRGVNVASIGNLSAARRPAIGPAVYYPPGIRSQAQTLARLSGAATIAPAPAGLGAAGTLVLVLTDSESALARYVP